MECSFCSREVEPTLHRRNGDPSYKVDYYRLFTGELSQVIIQNPGDESGDIEFYKLSSAREVIVCADCFARDEVKQEMEKMFSGAPEQKE